ncbi:hypothetical protein ABG768_022825 [Culter alburnus]|uniref:Uncharacterized protein n=1 Tax=Culter alburnus TaxID=194366 RepID=A0AAW2ANR7_CULAL
MQDILFTAASDSEDFRAGVNALPPRSQEARPSAAYTELVDVLARATEKLNPEWPDGPCDSQSSKLDERFLSGQYTSCPIRRKLPFFICHHHCKISRP